MGSEEKDSVSDDFEFEDETYGPRPVHEIYGSQTNINKLGAPSEHADAQIRYYFYPTWRSQFFSLIGFFATCLLSVYLSDSLSFTVIKGELFSTSVGKYYLHLPLLILIPGFVLGKILISMYDAKYIIDERGVEAQVGLVSLSLRQPRLRYEDIRGVEPQQTLWERMLGIGGVMVGSAMTQDVEIVMDGVSNPRGIQLLIGGERDKRLRKLQSEGSYRTVSITGD